MDLSELRFQALGFLLDYSKGTLWWVNNDIWEQVIPDFVRKKGNKKHPGLSLAREKVEGLYSTIPMLIGTSRRKTGRMVLVVRNMSPEVSPDHDKLSYFTVLRPCPLRFDDFGRVNRIEQNGAKLRLDRDEMQRLDEILSGGEA